MSEKCFKTNSMQPGHQLAARHALREHECGFPIARRTAGALCRVAHVRCLGSSKATEVASHRGVY